MAAGDQAELAPCHPHTRIALQQRSDVVDAKAPEFNIAPNQLLADAIRGVRPGRALDVGTGMGRNAL